MTVTVRYIVNDVDEAIAFYCDSLGFRVEMHPAPTFAMLSRGDLRLVLSAPGGGPGGGQAMPDGVLPEPGGWNRFSVEVADLEPTVQALRERGARFRNEIVTGVGGKQILVEDPSGNPVELFEPTRPEARTGTVMERLRSAINAHDLDAFVGLLADDYRSDQPAHPARSFVGADQARRNWASVFAGIPDLQADLLVAARTDDGVELAEWDWHGTHVDGSPFAMRGTTVMGVRGGRIVWGRLYMEPVEDEGGGIDEMVHETYRPPAD